MERRRKSAVISGTQNKAQFRIKLLNDMEVQQDALDTALDKLARLRDNNEDRHEPTHINLYTYICTNLPLLHYCIVLSQNVHRVYLTERENKFYLDKLICFNLSLTSRFVLVFNVSSHLCIRVCLIFLCSMDTERLENQAAAAEQNLASLKEELRLIDEHTARAVKAYSAHDKLSNVNSR